MIPFVTKVHKNLDKQLQEIDLKEEDGIKKSQESISLIKNALPQLKRYISEHPFKDEQEEILFFKYQKPEIISRLLYHLKYHEIVGDFIFWRDGQANCYFNKPYAMLLSVSAARSAV